MPSHLELPPPQLFPDRRQSPGGGQPIQRNPRRHGGALGRQVTAAVRQARSAVAEGVDPRHVFKVRTETRVEDSAWAGRGLEPLGEAADGWQYFLITEDEAGVALRRDLDLYAGGADELGGAAPLSSVFGLISSIEPYGPDDRRGPGIPPEGITEPTVVDVELWPSPDGQTASDRLARARSVLERTGGTVIADDDRAQFTVLRARVSPAGLDALLDLPVVERIRTPPMPFIDPTDWLHAQADDLDYEEIGGEPVGVIDDGVVSSHPLLQRVVKAQIDVPDTYAWSAPGPHGTMVAGLAAYGDFEEPLREGSALTARPLYCARIIEPHNEISDRTRFPAQALEHRSVEQAIRTLHDEHGVRVFNLSVTDHVNYAGPHASVWTESLDRIIRELHIVCVVSAGNRPGLLRSDVDHDGRHYLRDYPTYCFDPVARVAEPGIGALALTVGSIARSAGPATLTGQSRVGERAVAEVSELSPFSRTGPGVRESGSVKPDLVHHGGNWVISDYAGLKTNDAGVDVVSLHASPTQRVFAAASGTSYSAPRVARLAADVWTRYPDASANLVRSLVALSARLPSETRITDTDKTLRAYGYGVPKAETAVESGANRVVLMYDGQLRTDSVAVHAFPLPAEFITGTSSRRFRIALAYDPPVRRQRREYLAGWMRVELLRGVAVDEIEEAYRVQDPDDRQPLFRDRRCPDLRPSSTQVLRSTLHVREWQCQRLNPDDPDTYYLVVTHLRAPWAASLTNPYDHQPYAICLEMVDEDRLDLDLYNLVRQRVEVRPEIRVRSQA